jgi:hypothetical protein
MNDSVAQFNEPYREGDGLRYFCRGRTRYPAASRKQRQQKLTCDFAEQFAPARVCAFGIDADATLHSAMRLTD